MNNKKDDGKKDDGRSNKNVGKGIKGAGVKKDGEKPGGLTSAMIKKIKRKLKNIPTQITQINIGPFSRNGHYEEIVSTGLMCQFCGSDIVRREKRVSIKDNFIGRRVNYKTVIGDPFCENGECGTKFDWGTIQKRKKKKRKEKKKKKKKDDKS